MLCIFCVCACAAKPNQPVTMVVGDNSSASASTGASSSTMSADAEAIQLAGNTVTSYPRKTGKPYVIRGVTYYPLQDVEEGYQETGIASYYGDGDGFNNQKTANGEVYDMYGFTAAHKTLPMPTFVRVENLENGKETVVRVNDRGPFAKGRIIDLSYAAAQELDMLKTGTAKVRITVLSESIDVPDGVVRTEGREVDLNVGRFSVQIGAFAVRSNADTLLAKYNTAAITTTTLHGQLLYRVRIQGYTTKTDATAALRAYEREYPDAFIVAD
ncbi:MAG: septal ring lytic transglycosylase RlpA family protein [Deferribacteraceae bacterium]|nr:septal ring lytic transglycosylase RlpA family protein [Deferribacteraceae bacterium]